MLWTGGRVCGCAGKASLIRCSMSTGVGELGCGSAVGGQSPQSAQGLADDVLEVLIRGGVDPSREGDTEDGNGGLGGQAGLNVADASLSQPVGQGGRQVCELD